MLYPHHLPALNSATKYPSIPTYHELDPATGGLLPGCVQFAGDVVATEKVDGTNARIVLLPDGQWLIGSRDGFLTARGDLVANPEFDIVATLRPIAARAARWLPAEGSPDGVVLFGELYGQRQLPRAREYSAAGAVGWRLFDVAHFPAEVKYATAEKAASLRQHGMQRFVDEVELAAVASTLGVELTPRLFTVAAEALPTGIAEMHSFLIEHVALTRAGLDCAGRGEGIVFRSPDRSVIAKARFENYRRTVQLASGSTPRQRREKALPGSARAVAG